MANDLINKVKVEDQTSYFRSSFFYSKELVGMYTETAQSEGDRDAFLNVGMEKKQKKG